MRCFFLAGLLAAAPILSGAARAQDAGDAAAGQRVFNQCRACHTINEGGRNGVGPNLWGVVDRKAASIEGFRYSANMRELGEAGHSWTLDHLRAYLRDPKAVAPRGIMAFAGIKNDAQLNDLLAYLQGQRAP